jgi:RNA polymerase sigma-70 factor (ECF subfamily)
LSGPAASLARDGDLIAECLSQNGQALEVLLDRYEAPLFHFLIGILKDHHLAEDALQETWCQALQHLAQVDANHLRGWLFTVAYHQAMLFRRRQRGRAGATPVVGDLVDPTPCPGTLVQDREEACKVRQMLERLSPAQREVICQRVYEGKRFRDIAKALDCPVNTALARMHEGLKKLRRLWGPDYV